MAVKRTTKAKTRGKAIPNGKPFETKRKASKPANKQVSLSETMVPSITDSVEQLTAPLQDKLPCMVKRPNRPLDFTCLDEMQNAIKNPQEYSDAQLTDILSENNLCENCR